MSNFKFKTEEFTKYLTNDAKSDNTIKGYAHDLTQFFDWLNKNYNSQSILTRDIVLSYKAYLYSINNIAQTINRKLLSLKKYNEYLVATKQQESLAIIKADIIKIQKKVVSPTDINDKDVFKFINKVQQNESIRNHTIVTLLLNTGMRISEALDLKISDIYFNDEEILCNGKGEKQRTIPMNSHLIDILKKYLTIRSSTSLYADKSPYLFVSQVGEQLSERFVEKMFNKYSNKITPHKLRHYFATYLIENGFDLHEVANMLGHGSINTTMIYLNPSKQKMKNKMDKLSLGII